MRARRPGIHVSMYLWNHSDIDDMVSPSLLVKKVTEGEDEGKVVSSWPVGNT